MTTQTTTCPRCRKNTLRTPLVMNALCRVSNEYVCAPCNVETSAPMALVPPSQVRTQVWWSAQYRAAMTLAHDARQEVDALKAEVSALKAERDPQYPQYQALDIGALIGIIDAAAKRNRNDS